MIFQETEQCFLEEGSRYVQTVLSLKTKDKGKMSPPKKTKTVL